MFSIHSINYLSLSNKKLDELFMLRKNSFKDRLQWAVNCFDGKEFDQFDNEKASYVFGSHNGVIICGTRIIDMRENNMLDNVFSLFFDKVEIPKGNYIESTRFFVDKKRTHEYLGPKFPVTLMLFLSLINYAKQYHYDGIIAVASHSMIHIIKKSGWRVSILATGISEKNESVYLLLGNIDNESQTELKSKILSRYEFFDEKTLNDWPLSSGISI